MTSDSRSGSKTTHIVDFVFNSECLLMEYYMLFFPFRGCSVAVPPVHKPEATKKRGDRLVHGQNDSRSA